LLININGKLPIWMMVKNWKEPFVIISKFKPNTNYNDHGNFKFQNLCEGTYQIIIQHIGCKDSILNFVLNKNSKSTSNYHIVQLN